MPPIPIPPGTWLYIKSLPPDATASEIANWFCESGIALSEDCVSIRHDASLGTTAIVSVNRESIRDILRWCLDRKPLRGKGTPIELFGTSKSAKRNERF